MDYQVVLDQKKDGDPEVVTVPGDPERTIPVVYFEKVRCPSCGTDQVRQYGVYGSVRYYRCAKCVPPGGRDDWCRFKAIER